MDVGFEEVRLRGLESMRRGSFAEANAYFGAAEGVASTPAEAALAQIHLASVSVLQGVASRRIDELPLLLMRHDSPHHVYLAAYYLAIHFAETRQAQPAARYRKVLLAAAEEMGDPYYLASAYDVISDIARSSGEFAAAHEYSLRAGETIAGCAPSEESALARAVIRHNLGYALLCRGFYGEAIAPLRAGAAALEACAAGFDATNAHLNLAFAHFALGDIDESEEELGIVDERIAETTEWLRKYVYYIRGEIAQRRGRHAEARAEYRRLAELYPAFANLVDLLSSVSLFPLLLPERT